MVYRLVAVWMTLCYKVVGFVCWWTHLNTAQRFKRQQL